MRAKRLGDIHTDAEQERSAPMMRTREMGASRAEFMRILPAALGTSDYSVVGNDIVCTLGERRVAIRFERESQRRIANLELPILTVTLSLDGFDAAQAERFLQRFDLYFRRGGG